MALSAKGIVYLWGSSEHGQLGLGRKKQRKLPVQLKTEGKALGISAGAYHSAYVNSEGHLFTFGTCKSTDQLGLRYVVFTEA